MPSTTLSIIIDPPTTIVAGDTFSSTIYLDNGGPDPAANVVITETLPSGTSFNSQSQGGGPSFTLSNSGNTITDTISSLGAGDSVWFTVVANLAPSASYGSTVTSAVSVSTTTALSMMSNTYSSGNSTVDTSADVSVTNSAPPIALKGGVFAYALTVTNNGPSDAQSVSLSDTLPSGLTYVSQSQVSGSDSFTLSNSGSAVSDTLSTLPAGASDVIDILAYLPTSVSEGTSLSDTASVSTSTSDPSPGNNSSTASTKAYTFGPISLTNPGTQSSTEGGTPSLSLSASDGLGATLIYAATNLPPGLYVNSSTGVISGTVAAGDAANSPYSVTATASDGSYDRSQTFVWNVSSPISITNPGTQSGTEGSSASLSISASDSIGGSTLSYAATGLPTGLKINTSTGAITGTVGLNAAANGPYSVTVVAVDGTYSASTSFTWNIVSPVTLAAIADQTNSEGDSPSLSVSAADGSSGTMVFTALGLPLGLKISTSTGTITGTVAPGTAADGPYSVTVVANDGTYSASQSFTWTISNPISITTPADQTNNESDTVSLSITAADASSGTLVYGATGLPSGLSINSSTGSITGTVSIGDAANGPYSVILFAADGTYSNLTSFNWTINSTITLTGPSDQSNTEGDTVSVTESATDTHSGTLVYSATGLPPGASINSSTGTISGTLSAGGDFSPTVSLTDGTYTTSASFDWEVDSPISITDPGAQASHPSDAVSLQIQASTTGTGSLSYSASGLPWGVSINSSTGLISGTVNSGASASIGTVTLTVTDGTSTGKDVFSWTIYSTSSVSVTNPGTQTTSEGSTVSLSISTSYSGSGTLSYSAEGLPPGLKINTSTGAITGTLSAGDSVFGPYTVTVTATDGTDFDSQTFTYNTGSPISLTNPGTQTSTEGGSVSLSISASYGGGSLTSNT